jgi:hypothetical protein
MINDAIRQIRDTVNKSVFLHNIERHGFLWDMVTAPLDMLGDTQLAIEAYQDPRHGDVGHHYLEAYGDVIREISKARYCIEEIRKGLEAPRADSKSTFYFEAHLDSLKQTYEGIVEVCKSINAEFKQSNSQ